MHGSVQEWFPQVLFRGEVEGRSVLEAGARNENGSVREFVESMGPASYLGTDMRKGPGVDVIIKAEDLPGLTAVFGTIVSPPAIQENYDIVISTEMLEHAEDWRGAVKGMLEVLAEDGLLFITTRSKGFSFHGYPHDYWRYSRGSMRKIIEDAGMEIIRLDDDPDCPGVFLKARKPAGWKFPEGIWQDIILDPPE